MTRLAIFASRAALTLNSRGAEATPMFASTKRIRSLALVFTPYASSASTPGFTRTGAFCLL
ncbi:hypothetical protein D3C87_1496920 [compost metagenome]